MYLRNVVDASKDLAETRSRKKKTERIGQLLADATRTGRAEDGVSFSADDVAVIVGLIVGKPRQGKIGVGFAAAFAIDTPPAEASSLTTRDVDAALTDLGRLSGAGSQSERSERLTTLFSLATRDEQEFLRRVLTGEVRHGALESLVLDGVALAAGVDGDALRRAAMLSGDVAAMATLAFSGGSEALASVGLTPMTAVLPMLAQTAKTAAEAITSAGHASVECKLDGVRIQAHREGERIAIFTRALNEITDRLPEVVRMLRELPAETIVLDGEALGLREDGRPLPFEETMSRVGSETVRDDVPIRPFFFDILHLDGVDLIDRPLTERWAALDRIVPEDALVTRVWTEDGDEAEAFLARSKAAGHEGIVVKGSGSIYEAGRRGAKWLKVKPAHTLDLVVLAAEWGSGRREGWLSNLHLGARDPETGEFVMLGKTFKGLTDAMLAWQTERFLGIETRRTKHIVYVRPEVVAEIAFDGIQPSPRYPAGMALRFARVRAYRSDKSADEADTIDTVRQIFQASRGA
ncbi:MAG: ATP-dependent DNA ligase [Candidatus Eisenbacteria bacterium]